MQSTTAPAKSLGYRDSLALFNSVQRGYRKVKELPDIVCSQVDPQSHPSLRKTPESIHFAVDVERITSRVLRDDKELQSAWFAMLNEQPVDAEVGRRLVLRCGRVYGPLNPIVYFTRVRRKRGEPLTR